jgi:hypothetical protein
MPGIILAAVASVVESGKVTPELPIDVVAIFN